MELNAKIPDGPIADKWTNYKFDRKLVNPANRRKYDIIVVGTGLAGGSAPLPGLTEAVTQQTGFACSAVNPFDGMEIGSSVRLKKMVREAPSYLTSCGLAMRRFLQ